VKFKARNIIQGTSPMPSDPQNPIIYQVEVYSRPTTG
jgi:hypothetical protein